MRRLAYEDGKASCGPGGRTDVDPVFVDEGGFVHQLIAVGDEGVKEPAHLLSTMVSSCRILWRRGWGHTRRHVSRLETLQKFENEVEDV